AVDFGDKLQAMLDGAKLFDCGADALRSDAGDASGTHGGKDIFDIVLAFERNGRGFQNEFGSGLLGSAEEDRAFVDEGSLAHDALTAEPEDARAGVGGAAHGGIVVGVEDESVLFSLVG